MFQIGQIAALFSLLILAGCAVNPVTGKKELSLIPASQELAIGTKNYGPYQQQQGGRYSVDPDLGRYVNQIGLKLAQYSKRSKLPYQFVVLNNDSPNAWALPGGKIAINRGLLTLLDDEAQLAAVLSHEIIHAAAKHSVNQMTQSILLGIGMQAATVASKNTDYGHLASMGAGLGGNLWSARYGRQQELESDFYGMELMARAGYHPQAAVELQETFVRLSQQGNQAGWLQALFASHPPSTERVAKNKAKAEAIGNVGIRNRSAYQQAIAQITRDSEAYKAQQQAIAAAGKNDIAGALGLIDSAINIQPEEALFHVTKAQLLLSQKQDSRAMAAFSKAAALNPEYYIGHLGLGLIQKKQKRWTQAASNLKKSTQLLPTQIAIYHLGEIELTQGNKKQAIEYFKVAQQHGGSLGEKAQAQLQDLLPPPVNTTTTSNSTQ